MAYKFAKLETFSAEMEGERKHMPSRLQEMDYAIYLSIILKPDAS
jgi:hypothetical protein